MKLIKREVQRYLPTSARGLLCNSAMSGNQDNSEDVGILKSYQYWSNVFKRDMHFSFYSPDEEDLYPLLYILPDANGIQGVDDVVTKSSF